VESAQIDADAGEGLIVGEVCIKEILEGGDAKSRRLSNDLRGRLVNTCVLEYCVKIKQTQEEKLNRIFNQSRNRGNLHISPVY
jgi:hypothetical protein